MINVNKLDKKLSTKTFNVWVYKNKYKTDLDNYYIVFNVIKWDKEGIKVYLEKETSISKNTTYKNLIKFINNFKKEFKKQWLNKNKDWFNFYVLID